MFYVIGTSVIVFVCVWFAIGAAMQAEMTFCIVVCIIGFLAFVVLVLFVSPIQLGYGRVRKDRQSFDCLKTGVMYHLEWWSTEKDEDGGGSRVLVLKQIFPMEEIPNFTTMRIAIGADNPPEYFTLKGDDLVEVIPPFPTKSKTKKEKG